GKILRGKLMSVAWPLFLLMCATLPGYVVMMTVSPETVPQVQRVVICLMMTAVFAGVGRAPASSVVRLPGIATAGAHIRRGSVCIAPLLAWLGRDAPFGHRTVQTVLTVSPVAAALHASDTPGFTGYELLPANWWLIGGASLILLLVLIARTRRLYRPD